MTEPTAEGRRWFGPAVIGGLVGTGLAALAGSKPWAAPDSAAASALVDHTGGHVPLAGALGLVGLAAWGVLLVTRGVVRRLVAALGAIVAVGLVATVVVGRSSALDSARSATVDVSGHPVDAHVTGWWYAALVASVLALAASGLAVRLVRTWPEMGSRYDAPGATAAAGGRARRTGSDASAAPADLSDMDEADLWRAIDQGHDPTDPGDDRDH